MHDESKLHIRLFDLDGSIQLHTYPCPIALDGCPNFNYALNRWRSLTFTKSIGPVKTEPLSASSNLTVAEEEISWLSEFVQSFEKASDWDIIAERFTTVFENSMIEGCSEPRPRRTKAQLMDLRGLLHTRPIQGLGAQSDGNERKHFQGQLSRLEEESANGDSIDEEVFDADLLKENKSTGYAKKEADIAGDEKSPKNVP